jgi:hypothetical protein
MKADSNCVPIGLTIMIGALLIFAERFLWAWHLCDLRDKHAFASPQ